MPPWSVCERFADNDGSSSPQYGHHNNNRKRSWLRADTSFTVATCYIGLLTIAALVVCYRSRTRLRLYAAFCTCWGLTIAVAGLLRSKLIIGPIPFWLWNFIAEPIGILALMYTITSVGSGFYPMAGHRNIFWKVAMGLLVIYALMAVGHVAMYVVDRALFRPISGQEIQELWSLIIQRGIRTKLQLEIQESLMQCRGMITDGNRFEVGARNWTDLTWTERDMYGRPNQSAYSAHQMFMIFTFGWVSAYLFVPLLNHHRRRGPVGRPLDSDMMAVGVWYMTCITIVVLAYAILNIYYFFVPEIVFEQQAQALDLCVRATIGPIFFVPAPAYLIKFYRRHFNNSNKGGNSGGGYRGRIDSAGCNTGYHSSFTNPDDPIGTLAPTHSRAGSRIGYTDDAGYLKPSADEPMHQIDSSSNNRHTSLGSMYGRMRFFHSRSRGASMESNKVFNQDFESEDGPESQHTNDDHLSRPDSIHQYHSHLEAARTMSEDSTLYQLSPTPFGGSTNRGESSDPLTGGLGPSSIELQRPQQAFTKAGFSERQPGTSWSASSPGRGRSDSGTLGNFSNTFEKRTDVKGDSQKNSADTEETLMSSPDTAGTTGWELGGWGHVRQDSEGNNENSLSHPLEEPYPPPSPSSSPYPDDLLSVSERGVDAQNGSVDFPEPPRGRSKAEPSNSHGQELTGLQKQLAEYRSALLPVVMAMQDEDARDTPSLTFDSRDDPHRQNGDAPYDFGPHSHYYHSRSGGRAEGMAVRRLSSDSPSSSGFSYIATSPNERTTSITATSSVAGVAQDKEKEKVSGQELAATVHAVDPLHWTKHPSSPTKKPALALGGRGDYEEKAQLTSTQNGDKHVAVFKKKWLAGRKSTENDRQLPQSKLFEADHHSPTSNVSKSESKSSKYSSGNFAVEVVSPVKGRAKDGRRGVFSKVLSGSGNKAGDWARPSQDIYDQERDHSPHPPITKSEGKSSGPVHISAPSPATVEALALSSTRSRLVDEDEDRGLQYYYPDPYSSLAEFKRPHGAVPELGGSSSAKDRTAPSTSQRHPLSPRPSADGTLTDLAFLSGIKSSDGSSYKTGSSSEFSHGSNMAPENAAKGSSSKLSKNALHSKKSPKAEVAAAPTPGSFGFPASSTHPSYPTQSFSAASSPLSRSGSGSKKLKSKQRGNRSKSDVPAARSSMDVGPASPVATMTALPITATRKPSIGLAITQPAKTSLSPPPRQSWTRSKSFQGTTSAITAAILSKTIGGAIQQGSICVDTALANELQQGEVIAENDTPSSGLRNSLSSSESPKPGTMSPLISPTDAVFEERNNNAFSASSPPSSPPMSSLSRLGGLRPRVQEHRHNSLDRETEYRTGMGKDRTGFSTAAMDLRRANSRHQRSVDNLASAYYYRRAAELSSKGNGNNNSSSIGIKEERERQPMLGTLDVSSSSSSSGTAVRPSSPQVGGYGGFTYYGVGGGDSSSGRNSPAPQGSSSSSHRDSGSYNAPQYQKSKTSLEYSLPGGIQPHHRLSPVTRMNDGPLNNNSSNEHNRTGSLTNSHLMADDPWTQALIARASGNTRPHDNSASQSSSAAVGAQGKYHHQHQHHRSTRSVDATASMDHPSPILAATGSHGAGGAYNQKGSEPSAR